MIRTAGPIFAITNPMMYNDLQNQYASLPPHIYNPYFMNQAIDPLKDPLGYSMQYINKDFGGNTGDHTTLAGNTQDEGVKQGLMAKEQSAKAQKTAKDAIALAKADHEGAQPDVLKVSVTPNLLKNINELVKGNWDPSYVTPTTEKKGLRLMLI